MASSIPSTDAFTESFPIQPNKVPGQPTYDSLTCLSNEVKLNAASVPSNHGGGSHGYLVTVVMSATTTMYDMTVAPGQPFTIPAYPGAQPIISPAATATQLNQSIQQHMEYLRE
jgi:hypothetical protein